jgi:hypothetical protein
VQGREKGKEKKGETQRVKGEGREGKSRSVRTRVQITFTFAVQLETMFSVDQWFRRWERGRRSDERGEKGGSQ